MKIILKNSSLVFASQLHYEDANITLRNGNGCIIIKEGVINNLQMTGEGPVKSAIALSELPSVETILDKKYKVTVTNTGSKAISTAKFCISPGTDWGSAISGALTGFPATIEVGETKFGTFTPKDFVSQLTGKTARLIIGMQWIDTANIQVKVEIADLG